MKAAPVLLLQQSVEASERCRKLRREHSRTERTLEVSLLPGADSSKKTFASIELLK